MIRNRTKAPWLWWVGAGLAGYILFYVLVLVFQPFGEKSPQLLGDLFYIPSSLCVSILAFVVSVSARDRRMSTSWKIIGLAFASQAIGDILWAWSDMVLGVLPTSPALSDIFYLSFYVLFIVGLLQYPNRGWDRAARGRLLLDIGIVVAAVAVFIWYFSIAPLLAQQAESLPARVIELLYPIMDLVLIWVAIVFAFSQPAGIRRLPLLLIILGMGLTVLGDVIYATVTGADLYYAGHPIDLLWLLGAVTVGWAALAQCWVQQTEPVEGGSPEAAHSLERETGRIMRRSQQYLPYAAILAVYSLLIISMAVTPIDARQWGLVLGTAFVMLLGLLRQLLLFNEASRLAEQLLSQSKDLERRVAERTAELDARVEEVTRLHAQVQKANEELRQVDQLKSEFLSNVSHELRTPLSVILAYAELLLDSEPGDLKPIQIEFVQVIHNNGKRLHGLVDDLLDVQRQESGRFSISVAPLEPEPLLRELVAEARVTAANKQQVVWVRVASDLPTVPADGARVAQVLNNLLSNAMKFTPAGGMITVDAFALAANNGFIKSTWDGDCSSFSVLPAGQWLLVCVHDTGIGIPPEEIPQLFSRFYRGKRAQLEAYNGAGLGLYVARMIVEAHNGHLGVESQSGQGSLFWFALPVADSQSMMNQPAI